MENEIKKVLLKDIAEIKFCIVNSPKNKEQCKALKWLTAANLLQDNVVSEISKDERYIEDDTLRIFKDDILIKRISPSYINYIGENLSDVYASNNLILVRTGKNSSAKYLAFILSRKIKDISENASVGSAMPSIGRAELERFEVPMPPLNKQIAIGEIWEKSIEKKKMYIRLAQLENIKENYMINKLINGENGGVNNDHI